MKISPSLLLSTGNKGIPYLPKHKFFYFLSSEKFFLVIVHKVKDILCRYFLKVKMEWHIIYG
jgi:hypothetical protein